ncbi:MAG: hypothetical protein LBP70_02620 [Mycoplasmataceae bacterium]|nr:hypothetical protein [Mycoplasmataceae bacterium]
MKFNLLKMITLPTIGIATVPLVIQLTSCSNDSDNDSSLYVIELLYADSSSDNYFYIVANKACYWRLDWHDYGGWYLKYWKLVRW